MFRYYLILIYNLLSQVTFAQQSFLSDNQFSTSFYNPTTKGSELNFYYQNKFFIREWNLKGIALSLNKNKSTCYFQYLRNGNSKYANNQFKLLYHYSLSPVINVAVGINSRSIQQQLYKTKLQPLQPLVNISFQPYKNYRVNISLNTTKEHKYPNQIHSLFSRNISKQLKLLLGLSFSTKSPLSFESGIVYFIRKNLNVELNINSSRSPIIFGIRYKIRTYSLIVSSEFHETLGSSISAQFQFKIK